MGNVCAPGVKAAFLYYLALNFSTKFSEWCRYYLILQPIFVDRQMILLILVIKFINQYLILQKVFIIQLILYLILYFFGKGLTNRGKKPIVYTDIFMHKIFMRMSLHKRRRQSDTVRSLWKYHYGNYRIALFVLFVHFVY